MLLILQGSVPAHIRSAAERSQSEADLRSASEEAVAAGKAADANLLAAYMAYIGVGGATGAGWARTAAAWAGVVLPSTAAGWVGGGSLCACVCVAGWTHCALTQLQLQ